jgi:hypothetical protein
MNHQKETEPKAPHPGSTRVHEIANAAMALACVVAAATLGYKLIGLPPMVIVGGSGLVAFIAWSNTYLKRPAAPETILPVFLLTVAALEIHMTEEYLRKFGPAMSRLFNIPWTERGFLLVFAFIGPALYALTALGLLYRVRFAGFVAWFIFIGPGVAEFTHFIFPLLRPALSPQLTQGISHTFPNGTYIADMPNYFLDVTGRYYFAGMYTAVLPMIPGIYAIYRLIRADRQIRSPMQRPTQPGPTATSARHDPGPGRHIPERVPADRLREVFPEKLGDSALLFGVFPVGTAFGRWISKVIALPQLRKLTAGKIPWTPLRKPLAESTVALISTGGVHLRSDHPFNLNGDPSFRVIPRRVQPDELTISHQAYDRTDAFKDINLVFPIERLRELESEHVIGRLAEEHYGFGLMPSAKGLMPAIKEVARRISEAGVDLALLVPA